MKHFRHILLVLPLLLLLSGCELIYDDMDDCATKENLILLFTRTVAGADEFSGNVESVDVMVFDEEGRFVTRKVVSQTALHAFRTTWPDGKSGTRLTLDPGTYRIVCWGNAGNNTSYLNLAPSDSFDDALLRHPACDSGSGATFDPLYYAPRMDNMSPGIFTVTVSDEDIQTRTIDFTAAHKTVEIYIKGFGTGSGSSADLPEVEVAPMSWGYDFQMHARDDSPFRLVRGAWNVNTASGIIAGVQFHTALFGNNNPILIRINDPRTHGTVYTVELKKFLADNNITLDPTDHDLIRIMVEFIGADVKLTVPNWSGSDIKPAF